jgi:hypothetical protein
MAPFDTRVSTAARYQTARVVSTPRPALMPGAPLSTPRGSAVSEPELHMPAGLGEDDPETLDVTQYFENLGPGPEPRGRPDDYPGVEIQTILHVLRSYVAGKQFAPDPTGEHRAVKVSDYNIGWEFIPTYVVIDSLGKVFKLLKSLEENNSAFLVRGMVGEWAGTRRKRRGTTKFVDIVKRRMIDRHDDGALENVDRQLQMLDLDSVPLLAGTSVVDDPAACVV